MLIYKQILLHFIKNPEEVDSTWKEEIKSEECIEEPPVEIEKQYSKVSKNLVLVEYIWKYLK